MLPYVARRMFEGLLVVLASTFLVFVLVSASGDPLARLRLVPGASEETIQRTIEEKRLDAPVVIRYGYWVRDIFSEGFGTTLIGSRPIWPDLRQSLVTTVQILIPALAVAAVGGTVLGLISARAPGRRFDKGTTWFTSLGFSIPEFWLGLTLQTLATAIFTATGVRLFYTTGLASADPEFLLLDRLQHVTLPIIVLALPGIAVFSRFVRAAAMSVVDARYITAARARGLSVKRVLFAHVLRASSVPLVALMGLEVGRLFGGTIVVETVFGIDGLGRYFLDALANRDIYAVMAWMALTAPAVVLANLAADIVHAHLDPRIRHA